MYQPHLLILTTILSHYTTTNVSVTNTVPDTKTKSSAIPPKNGPCILIGRLIQKKGRHFKEGGSFNPYFLSEA